MSKSILDELTEEFQTLPKMNINKNLSEKEKQQIDKTWNESLMTNKEVENLKQRIQNNEVTGYIDENGDPQLLRWYIIETN